MINYIWCTILIISIVFGFVSGNIANVSDAALSGAADAVTLLFSMLGMMAFWSGFMKIAEKGGLTQSLAKVFSPLLSKLMPKYKNNEEVKSAVSTNVTANLLGLGNAATPLGLEAMRRMHQDSADKKSANNSMVVFVVLNTASIQLIPTTVAILRKTYGSETPMDILPCVWISSAAALIAGITTAKSLEKKRNFD